MNCNFSVVRHAKTKKNVLPTRCDLVHCRARASNVQEMNRWVKSYLIGLELGFKCRSAYRV